MSGMQHRQILAVESKFHLLNQLMTALDSCFEPSSSDFKIICQDPLRQKRNEALLGEIFHSANSFWSQRCPSLRYHMHRTRSTNPIAKNLSTPLTISITPITTLPPLHLAPIPPHIPALYLTNATITAAYVAVAANVSLSLARIATDNNTANSSIAKDAIIKVLSLSIEGRLIITIGTTSAAPPVRAMMNRPNTSTNGETSSGGKRPQYSCMRLSISFLVYVQEQGSRAFRKLRI